MKYWCYSYDQDKKSFVYSEKNLNQSVQPNQVCIRPILVGVCGSDIKQIITGTKNPRMGHEWVGIIEEIGTNVQHFKINEKVVSVAHICCEKCDFCLQGDFDSCTNRQLLGGKYSNVFASSIVLQQNDILKVPQQLSFEDIALFEVAFIGDTAYDRAKSIGLKRSDKCIIFGAGPIGIFTALSLKLRGHDVTIIETKPDRIKMATGIGLKANHYAKAMLNSKLHHSFDAVFDCSGDNHGPGAIKSLPAFPKINGIIVIVGKYNDAQLTELHYAGKSLRLTWVANHEKDVFIETIKFWTPHISQYASIVSQLYRLEEINSAFNDAIASKNIKNLIKVN